MGVAQSSVREALQQLESLGLVVKFPNRGSFVVDFSEEQSRQAYVVRSTLEGLAIGLALPRCTSKDVKHLRGLLARMRASTRQKDFEEFIETDMELHSYVWKLSANPYLEKALQALAAPQFAYYKILLMSGRRDWDVGAVMNKHAEIIERLENRSKKDPRRIIDELRRVVWKNLPDEKGSAADLRPSPRRRR
jgi:DNA-binding GntR family transcriptional regulator